MTMSMYKLSDEQVRALALVCRAAADKYFEDAEQWRAQGSRAARDAAPYEAELFARWVATNTKQAVEATRLAVFFDELPELHSTDPVPEADPQVELRDDDGVTWTGRLSVFLRDNETDLLSADALRALVGGERLHLGGGAAPAMTLSLTASELERLA